MRRRLCWGGEPFLHSMQIQGHIQRWSQDDWANVAPSTLHHMIHASATPGRNPHRHGGHLFNTGASCISTHSNKRAHADVPTRLNARSDTHMAECTHRYTSVNEMLSAHVAYIGKMSAVLRLLLPVVSVTFYFFSFGSKISLRNTL